MFCSHVVIKIRNNLFFALYSYEIKKMMILLIIVVSQLINSSKYSCELLEKKRTCQCTATCIVNNNV